MTMTRSNCSPAPLRVPRTPRSTRPRPTRPAPGGAPRLRWDAVDFVGGLIHVRRNFTGGREKAPKGKRVRSVPMMPDVIDTLSALKEREHFTGEDDLVFPSDVGEHLDHFALRKRFYAALEAAGLRRIRFHDLRHAFGSAAIPSWAPTRCRATWAISTTRQLSAICTTSRVARTRLHLLRRLERQTTVRPR
jgi:integrase